MAMTKAETARVAELERELTLRKVLSWPAAAPAPMPLPTGTATATGWLVAGDLRTGPRVELAWSQSDRHGWGWAPTRGGSASKGGIRLYRTKLDAIIAARMTMTEQAAEILAKLDSAIDAERQRERPTDGQP